MKSIIITLFNTKKGLELLNNEFEDDLNKKSLFIFGFYALIPFLFNFETNKETIEYAIIFFELVIAISLFILIGYLISYFLFKIGEKLKGKANFIEIFSLYAYAYIPVIIGYIMISILKKIEFNISNYNVIYLNNLIVYISYFLSFKILFQGLLKFNSYGIKNAIINILPFVTVQGIFIIYKLL